MQLTELRRVKDCVWPVDAAPTTRTYGIFDCARDPGIYDLVVRSTLEHGSLFAGPLAPELARAAPVLAELQLTDPLTDNLLRGCWSDAWGIVVQTDAAFAALRRHLRTLLRVRGPDGQLLLFRYYDPRVMRAYLPTCNPQELGLLFGEHVHRFIVPLDSSGQSQGCMLKSGALVIRVA